MAQLAQCLGFDLPNSLAGNVELLADLFQRVIGSHLDAEAHAQNFRFACGQPGQYLAGRFPQALTGGGFEQSGALPEESDSNGAIEFEDLPRLIFRFDQRSFGRLRRLIERINQFA